MGIGEEGNVEMRGVGWEFVTRESVRGGGGGGSDQDLGGRRASWQTSSQQQTQFFGGAAWDATWSPSCVSILRAEFVGCCGGTGEGEERWEEEGWGEEENHEVGEEQ